MGNCNQKKIPKCFYCNNIPNKQIYIVTITHSGRMNGKDICSLCYEQKVLEKHNFNIKNKILPIKDL